MHEDEKTNRLNAKSMSMIHITSCAMENYDVDAYAYIHHCLELPTKNESQLQ